MTLTLPRRVELQQLQWDVTLGLAMTSIRRNPFPSQRTGNRRHKLQLPKPLRRPRPCTSDRRVFLRSGRSRVRCDRCESSEECDDVLSGVNLCSPYAPVGRTRVRRRCPIVLERSIESVEHTVFHHFERTSLFSGEEDHPCHVFAEPR